MNEYLACWITLKELHPLLFRGNGTQIWLPVARFTKSGILVHFGREVSREAAEMIGEAYMKGWDVYQVETADEGLKIIEYWMMANKEVINNIKDCNNEKIL